MGGIGIITNPHSKLNRRNPKRQELLTYIAGQAGDLRRTNNLKELEEVAADFAQQGVEIVAINGGDGTISCTLSALARVYGDKPLPKITLLRGGTMNMLADNLRIHGSPEELLFKLLAAHSRGSLQERRIRTLKVEDKIGFLFANGSSARFLDRFYQNKTGTLGALWLLLKVALKQLLRLNDSILRRDLFELQLDEREPYVLGSCSIMCSTVEKLPLRIRLFKGAEALVDRFRVLAIDLNEKQLIAQIPLICLAPVQQSQRFLNLDGQRLRVLSRSAHKAIYTIDGEIYHPESSYVEIGLGPTIHFLIPQ